LGAVGRASDTISLHWCVVPVASWTIADSVREITVIGLSIASGAVKASYARAVAGTVAAAGVTSLALRCTKIIVA
jgi:hypothetical protein